MNVGCKATKKTLGFTIIEVIVVVAIVGILASIVGLSYANSSKKAVIASLTSDLDSAQKQIKIHEVNNKVYPTTIDCGVPESASVICLKSSPGNQLTLISNNTIPSNRTFCVAVENVAINLKYHITNDGVPETGDCSLPAPTNFTATATAIDTISLSWTAVSGATSYILQRDTTPLFEKPTVVNTTLATSVANTGLSKFITYYYRLMATTADNVTFWTAPVSAAIDCSKVGKGTYIRVPGSKTYNTVDFCVAKYEARNLANVVWSVPTGGNIWVNIQQSNAAGQSAAVCSGCHLITEAQWMTIAQNVANVPSNWSGGAVGNGYIYSGHNDNVPSTYVDASPNDADGYVNTSGAANQRRTLTLSNGEVIWDFAGNVAEWTAGVTTGVQQPGIPGNNYSTFMEWTSITVPSSLAVDPTPGGTGILGASIWNSTKGIGKLMSSTTDGAGHTFGRGGRWVDGGVAGIFAINLYYGINTVSSDTAFRVAH